MPKGLKTGGRVSGTPNLISGKVKQALGAALDNYEGGPVAYLELIRDTERKVFCQLLGRILPRQMVGKDDEPLIPKPRTHADDIEACRRTLFLLAKVEKGCNRGLADDLNYPVEKDSH